MTAIPLIDLQAQYQSIKQEIDSAIQRVLDSGQFILGPEGEALEQQMRAYCGTSHAVAVASGTDALELSLRALGIQPGDEVITTAYSFIATAEAITAVGAIPVFADIDLATYALDPTDIEDKLSARTKAILPVHLYGHPCDMDRLMEIAQIRQLKVIEDCAQAIGSTFRAHPVGSFGHAGCFSFYPSKNLGGFGDGGMVVTNDATLAEELRLLRSHGARERYVHSVLGTNSRLDELQAAILRVKLRYLDSWNAARRKHAAEYTKRLESLKGRELILPQEAPGCKHTYHLYTLRSKRRDVLKKVLADKGITSQIAYPYSLPQQVALASFVKHEVAFPNAKLAAKEVLSLPMYPELTSEQIEQVVSTILSSS